MLTWRPLPPEDEAFGKKLATVLAAWQGTPYHEGQQAPGLGVDCVRFVCAVLDEMLLRERTPISTLPPDAAMHNRAGALGVMKKIASLYPHVTVEDESLEPGDVVVVGPRNGGPGHAMIVGTQKNVLWHAVRPRVSRTGVGEAHAHDLELFRVYRPKVRTA